MDTSSDRGAVDLATEGGVSIGLLVSTRLGLVGLQQVELLSEFFAGLGSGLSELKTNSVISGETLRGSIVLSSHVQRILREELFSSLSALLADSESRVPLCAHPQNIRWDLHEN